MGSMRVTRKSRVLGYKAQVKLAQCDSPYPSPGTFPDNHAHEAPPHYARSRVRRIKRHILRCGYL